MKEIDFRFEPIWVAALSGISVYIFYLFIKEFTFSNFEDDATLAFLLLPPILLGAAIFPMTFKMLIGIPAIKLTADQLVDNVWGLSIGWEEISDIRISGVRKPFLAIMVKDKKKILSSINNPIKRTTLRLLFLLSPGDISINLAFVAGSNEAIIANTQVCWSRFYGHNE